MLRIIDECDGSDRDACEERIKALVPPDIYQRVLTEMYGPLRRNDYRITYTVRPLRPRRGTPAHTHQPQVA